MKKHPYRRTILTASATIVLVALALFVVVDRNENVASRTDAAQKSQPKSASVGNLIGGLEARLADNPEDAKGWLLLARSHDHLGNHAAAWNAYSRARELGQTDDTLELKLAASMASGLDE